MQKSQVIYFCGCCRHYVDFFSQDEMALWLDIIGFYKKERKAMKCILPLFLLERLEGEGCIITNEIGEDVFAKPLGLYYSEGVDKYRVCYCEKKPPA